MIDLIIKNLGAVASRECLGQTSIATELLNSDFERLVRILISLAHLHKSSKATGNISRDSLRRDSEGQLVLVINDQRPSLCESSAKGSPESRFYLNVGASPNFEDDLIALGVVIGELMVPPPKRPPLEGQYRETLADRLPKALKASTRTMRQLVRSLLCCQKSQFSSTAEFVSDVLGVVAFAQNNNSLTIKKIGWLSLARRRLRSTIAAVAIAFVLAWFGLSSFWSLESQFKDARRDLAALEMKIEELEDGRSTTQQNLKAPSSGSEQSPQLIPNRFGEEEAFLAFKDESILLLDQEFQKCINKNQITVEENKLILERLSACKLAANVWWGCVKQSLDGTSIDKKIAAQDESVQKVLRAWRERAVIRSEYKIVIVEHTCPREYEGYQVRITVENPNGKSRYAHRNFLVKDGKLCPEDSKSKLDFDVDWKDGEHLTLTVEYWSNWKVHWDNLYENRMTGELSLSRFSGLEVPSKNAYGFEFKFDLEPNLGPPTTTKASLPEISSAMLPQSEKLQQRGDGPSAGNDLVPSSEFK